MSWEKLDGLHIHLPTFGFTPFWIQETRLKKCLNKVQCQAQVYDSLQTQDRTLGHRDAIGVLKLCCVRGHFHAAGKTQWKETMKPNLVGGQMIQSVAIS